MGKGIIPCRLHPPLGGMSCGPTAVQVISGRTSVIVSREIVAAADEDGEFPQHLDDSNFRHQARALERFGFALLDRDGNEIIVFDAIPRHRERIDLRRLPSLGDFLAHNRSGDVLLCQAFRPGPLELIGHSFAVDRRHYADCNTNGRVIATAEVLKDVQEAFRVLDAYAVRKG
jgi:hypothetical protein